MLENIAFIAARNATSRAHAIAVYQLQTLIYPLQQASLSAAQLAPRAARLRDSLVACACTAPNRVTHIGLFDSAGVPLASRESRGPEAPSAAQFRRVMQHDEPQLYRYGSAGVMVASRLDRPAGAAPIISVVYSDTNDLSARLLQYVLDSVGSMVPTVLTGRTDNRGVFALIAWRGADTLFRSGPAGGAVHAKSWPFGSDSALTFTAITNGALAVPAMSPLSNRAWPVFGLTAATVLAVVASTSLALRSTQLARSRGDFAAAVSHELRTPLTEIVLFAELLESGRTSDADGVRDAARLIKTEARRLHHMVENVMHITRVDAHSFPVDIQRQPVRPLIVEVLESFNPIAAQRQCVIRLVCPEHLMLAVDGTALRQIVLNLLDNAVRYGPDAQRIAVRLTGDSVSGVMEVDDEGPGIPERERQRVWKPYVRLERDVARARTGTGLGLGVVSALVRQMHGRVHLTASERGGTLVVVTLPASRRT